jgi:hypothetical protein
VTDRERRAAGTRRIPRPNGRAILTGGADAASTNGMDVTVSGSQIDNNGPPPSSPRYGFDHSI